MLDQLLMNAKLWLGTTNPLWEQTKTLVRSPYISTKRHFDFTFHFSMHRSIPTGTLLEAESNNLSLNISILKALNHFLSHPLDLIKDKNSIWETAYIMQELYDPFLSDCIFLRQITVVLTTFFPFTNFLNICIAHE